MLETSIGAKNISIMGNATELLRLKSEISQIIPAEGLRIYKQKELLIPIVHLTTIAELVEKRTILKDTQSQELLRRTAQAVSKHLIARKRVLKKIETGDVLVGDKYWDETLMPYQALAVNCMIEPNLLGICIFDEQGTGKTLTTIAAFDVLKKRNECERMIVIAPLTLLKSWKNEFDRFLSGTYEISMVVGDKREKFEALNVDKDVYLVNYETAMSQETALNAVASSSSTLLVVDESFLVKNPAAKRSRSIESLRKFCIRGVVLCGTPAPNSPTDIVHQFNIADGGIVFSDTTFNSYKENSRELVRRAIDDKGVYLRRIKADVLPQLPDKHFSVIYIALSGIQADLYERAKHDLYLILKQLDNSNFKRRLTWYFQRRAALLQLCVNPYLIDPLYDGIPAKHQALDTLLDELISAGKKVVVWSVYTGDLLYIESRYADYGVVRVDGSVTGDSRGERVERFQKDPNCRIFVANPAAAGAGLTLHAADTCVYMSFSNQAAHYMQSLDRIHRKGQLAERVDYFFLICEGTIESQELQRLQRKEKAQKDLLGDPYGKGFTLADALQELES